MKILPMALYGTELANPPEEEIKKLAAAIAMAIAGRHSGKAVVATYENNKVNGRDLDPVSLIARHRILQLRRIIERKPEAEQIAKELIQEYNKMAEQGTVDGNVGFFHSTGTAPEHTEQSKADERKPADGTDRPAYPDGTPTRGHNQCRTQHSDGKRGAAGN